MTDPSIVAQGYDAVYDAMPHSPTLLRLWKQLVAGDDYPDDFYHISFITLPDLRRLARALNLSPAARFSDVACGMGGPALWIAREIGARLSGVDLLEGKRPDMPGGGSLFATAPTEKDRAEQEAML